MIAGTLDLVLVLDTPCAAPYKQRTLFSLCSNTELRTIHAWYHYRMFHRHVLHHYTNRKTVTISVGGPAVSLTPAHGIVCFTGSAQRSTRQGASMPDPTPIRAAVNGYCGHQSASPAAVADDANRGRLLELRHYMHLMHRKV